MPRDGTRGFTPLRDEAEADDKQGGAAALENTEAEQALLGAILVNNKAYESVVEIVRSGDFANPALGRIFTAIGTLIDRGEIANPVTLKLLFDQDGALASMGGARYLATLADSAVTIINAPHYAREIRKSSDRRALLGISQQLVADILHIDLDRTVVDIIEDFDRRIIEIGHHAADAPKPIADALDAALETAGRTFKENGRVTGITTGLIGLDKKLGGLHASDLIIIAGATSMGKTTLASGIAYAAARDGKQVYFGSQEMSAEQIAQRMLARWTGISVERQRAGPLSQADIDALVAGLSHLRSLPLTIDDKTRSVAQLRSRALHHKRRFGLDLIVEDYLQLLHSDRTRPENRTQEVSAISQGLKAIATELNVPVVALSQLSREIEKRDDKRPHLSDLRDSGSIEQDADQVLFPFREVYYLERNKPRQGPKETDDAFKKRVAGWEKKVEDTRDLAEIIIAKNRHGSFPHTLPVHFDGDRNRFYDLTTRTTDDE